MSVMREAVKQRSLCVVNVHFETVVNAAKTASAG